VGASRPSSSFLAVAAAAVADRREVTMPDLAIGNVNDTRVIDVTATRGGGNMTAAERVADLMKSDNKKDYAFVQKESAASKARMQWQPPVAEYREQMSHAHGAGHGAELGLAPGGFPNVTVADNHRVVGHSNTANPTGQAKMDGPASATKDWRTESSRIGRYLKDPTFKQMPYGTWKFNEGQGDSNPFNSRLF